MTTNKELQYRSLDQLIDVISVDLRSYYSDGVIEVGELIKVAQKCNYKLGLQINQGGASALYGNIAGFIDGALAGGQPLF